MPTEFQQPFRKLLERPSTSWLRLPAWVRGYGDEMLRYAERPNGRVCDTTEPADVALRIFAHPDEIEDLTEAIARLMKQGFLIEQGGALWIDNFAKAQENYEAIRKRNYRSRTAGDKEPAEAVSRVVPTVPDIGDNAPTGARVPPRPDSPIKSGTVPQEEIREDQRRGEDPPTPTEPEQRKPPVVLTPEQSAKLRECAERHERSFGQPSHKRADVIELHAEWSRQFNRKTPLVVGWNTADADILAAVIDSCGMADCLLVARHAKHDGMVSGRTDEQKAPHESIKYIFGNSETFSRILRDARKREAAKADNSPEAIVARAKAMGSGS